MYSQRTYVAIIDYLGFERMVKTDLKIAYNNLRSLVKEMEERGKYKYKNGWDRNSDFSIFSKVTETYVFSDSIIIIPRVKGFPEKLKERLTELREAIPSLKDGKPTDEIVSMTYLTTLYNIFFLSLKVMFGTAIKKNMPVRGAVSYGDIIVNKSKNIVIGKPIIEAYKLEKAQDWLGTAMHKSCEKEPYFNSLMNLQLWIRKYKPPLKSSYRGKNDVKYVLDWASDSDGYSYDYKHHLERMQNPVIMYPKNWTVV